MTSRASQSARGRPAAAPALASLVSFRRSTPTAPFRQPPRARRRPGDVNHHPAAKSRLRHRQMSAARVLHGARRPAGPRTPRRVSAPALQPIPARPAAPPPPAGDPLPEPHPHGPRRRRRAPFPRTQPQSQRRQAPCVCSDVCVCSDGLRPVPAAGLLREHALPPQPPAAHAPVPGAHGPRPPGARHRGRYQKKTSRRDAAPLRPPTNTPPNCPVHPVSASGTSRPCASSTAPTSPSPPSRSSRVESTRSRAAASSSARSRRCTQCPARATASSAAAPSSSRSSPACRRPRPRPPARQLLTLFALVAVSEVWWQVGCVVFLPRLTARCGGRAQGSEIKALRDKGVQARPAASSTPPRSPARLAQQNTGRRPTAATCRRCRVSACPRVRRQVSDVVESPEVAFTGDTTPRFAADPAAADALRAKVLIMECTFVDGALFLASETETPLRPPGGRVLPELAGTGASRPPSF